MLIICLPKLLGMCIIFAVPDKQYFAQKKLERAGGGGQNLIKIHKKFFFVKKKKRSLPKIRV